MTARLLQLMALAAAIAAVGCEQPSDGLSTVTGVVTVDGEPAEQGTLALSPLGADSRRIGSTIKDGAFSLKAAPGKARVMIYVPRVVGQQPSRDPNAPPRPIIEEALPARFNSNSELVIEVQPGASEHNFDLSST